MRLPTAADSRGEVLSELTTAAHSLRFDSGLTLSQKTPFGCVGLFCLVPSLSQICCFFAFLILRFTPAVITVVMFHHVARRLLWSYPPMWYSQIGKCLSSCCCLFICHS